MTPGRPRPRAILHVGTGKTGTTSIQRSLATHQDELAALGIHVLRSNRRREHIAKCSVKWNQADHPCWEALRTEIDSLDPDVHTIVFSQEGAFSTRPRGLKRLATLLEGFDTHVVMYVREQAEYVQSLILQHIKGRRQMVDVTNPIAVDLRIAERQLDFYDLARKFDQLFDSVEVRVFSRELLHRRDASADLFQLLGADELAEVVEPVESNPSITSGFAAVLHEMEQAGTNWHKDRRLMDAVLALSAQKHGSRYFLSQGEVETLRRRHAPGNRALIQQYVTNAPEIPYRDVWIDEPIDTQQFRQLLDDYLATHS